MLRVSSLSAVGAVSAQSARQTARIFTYKNGRARPDEPHGARPLNCFLCVDKPKGPSSFAVVRKVRAALKERRAGHAGTLDPEASGVLVIALGKVTRLLPFLPLEPKRYEFAISFGAETDTLDAAGKPLHTGGPIPAEARVREVLGRFVGSQLQQPPKFSSIKFRGERAYKLARKSVDFELAKRPVTIYELKMLSYDAAAAAASMEVVCSGGTYIRALARDIARELGTFGFASQVRRTAVGEFTLDRAVAWERIDTEGPSRTIGVREAVGDGLTVTITAQQKRTVTQGQPIPVNVSPEQTRLFAFEENGGFLAVLERGADSRFRPVRVFT